MHFLWVHTILKTSACYFYREMFKFKWETTLNVRNEPLPTFLQKTVKHLPEYSDCPGVFIIKLMVAVTKFEQKMAVNIFKLQSLVTCRRLWPRNYLRVKLADFPGGLPSMKTCWYLKTDCIFALQKEKLNNRGVTVQVFKARHRKTSPCLRRDFSQQPPTT